MIIEKYTPTVLCEMAELDATNRGDGGFGSTGVKEGEANLANGNPESNSAGGQKRSLAELEKVR